MKKVKILLLLVGGLIITTTNCLAKSNLEKDYIGDILYHPQSATVSKSTVSTQNGILLSSDLQIDLNSGVIERTFTLDTGQGVYDGYTRYIINGDSLTVETKTPFRQSTETLNIRSSLDLIESDSFLSDLLQAGEVLNTLRKSNSTPNQANIRLISKPIKQGAIITSDGECFGASCPGDEPPRPDEPPRDTTTITAECEDALFALVDALDAFASCRGSLMSMITNCAREAGSVVGTTLIVKRECPRPKPKP
ncbi:MAG: hypothetical protein L3J24_09170 [Xanthomonadales bacterium]|nr:hypothetical protein [Xanthomonadales bacterium]